MQGLSSFTFTLRSPTYLSSVSFNTLTIMRFTLALASLAFVASANAQLALLCTAGSCWNSPDNATDHGCQTWAGGDGGSNTCTFPEVTCTACLPCSTNATAGGCYTSPDQAEGTGCTSWAGGVDPGKPVGSRERSPVTPAAPLRL
ncbi:hypothetical protein BDZ89DRAFT_1129423 [Hymenopellis radicata]|nr:hypothetical protein BDZ89DRAFT_1129423 [Hymenopellis radicata]